MAATGHARTRANAPTNISVNFATGFVDYNWGSCRDSDYLE